jgi:hypothetical protein
MSPIHHTRSSRPLLLLGLAATLAVAACGVDPAPEATTEEAITTTDAAKDTTPRGQEMLYENWFYCGHVSYQVQIQYWYNLAYTGIIVGYIKADQYGPKTGIDYTVQIKTVHDDHHVWWSRGPATTSGPHLFFPASSTPGTVYPLSWEPYVRLYLGVDGDGLKNCNFDADLD